MNRPSSIVLLSVLFAVGLVGSACAERSAEDPMGSKALDRPAPHGPAAPGGDIKEGVTTTLSYPREPDSGDTYSVLWVGDVETGDVSQWRSVSVSGKADVEVVDAPTRSGDHALQLTNFDVDGTHNAGVRMNLQGPFGPDPQNLPDDAHYSAWYYIPFAFEGHSNVFQFKQSDVTERDESGDPTSHTRRMVWKAGLYWSGDGTYNLEVRTRIDSSSGEWQRESVRLGMVDADILPGEWFHLEVRYVWGGPETGKTTMWLNNELVWDESTITEASNLECMHRCREWVVGHYLSDYQGYVSPGTSWIFLDDAIVANDRTGTDREATP